MTGRFIISIIFFGVAGLNVMTASNISGDDTDRTGMNAYKIENFGGDSGELDRFTFSNQAYERDRQGPVVFSHKRHALEYQVNCWECHHTYTEDKKNTWAPWKETDKCDACHDPIEKKDGVISLMTAFHLNCITCHREKDIYHGEIDAYKDCSKCHLRDIRIENTNYAKDKMGPVIFQHRRHEDSYRRLDGGRIPCTECHHEYVEEENIWTEGDNVKACGTIECHDPVKTKGDRQYKLRTAYHKNCRECHRAMTEAGKSKDAPYQQCSSCHRR
jgi:hypothetical protein